MRNCSFLQSASATPYNVLMGVAPSHRTSRTMLMLVISILFCLFCANAMATDDDCTFSQPNQLHVMQHMAKLHPGGHFDAVTKKVTWVKPSKEVISFLYGGCDHVATTTTNTKPRTAPRTEKEVFTVAREMASTYWNKLESEILVQRLKSKQYKIEKHKDSVYYRVSHENYDEFYIQHSYSKGIDRVMIVWIGNY